MLPNYNSFARCDHKARYSQISDFSLAVGHSHTGLLGLIIASYPAIYAVEAPSQWKAAYTR